MGIPANQRESAQSAAATTKNLEPERAAPPKHEHKVGKHSSAEGELQRCFTVAPKEAASQPGSNESNYSAEREAASKLSLYGSYCTMVFCTPYRR